MELYQYWHSGDPPPDVAAWVEGFRVANPEFDHLLLDEGRAADFIAARYGPRERRAFADCGLPALQADYLRLCLMDAAGGLYLDASQQPHKPLAGLIAGASDALASSWCGLIATSVLMFRRPGNGFISACLRLATDNLIERRFEDVLITAGPGVFNALQAAVNPEAAALTCPVAEAAWAEAGWAELLRLAILAAEASPEIAAGYRQITLVEVDRLMTWITCLPAAYKAEATHWARWKGSIYRRPA